MSRYQNRSGVALAVLLTTLAAGVATGDDFTYEAIAERYGDARLDPESVRAAKMQGECLVGLKELNFQKRDDFDPVAEWTNYRSLSLLEQFPPCTVLIMIQVAREELIEEEASP